MTVTQDNLKDKRAEIVLQQLEELPTLPAVATRLLTLTSSEKATTAEVVRLIESDPSLTSRILRLVRRAEVGVRNEITTVERAVVMLGFDTVRSAVLAVSLFGVLRNAAPADVTPVSYSRDDLWKHCIAVACGAERLADELRRAGSRAVDPSEAFVCGLLHDLGKVALDATLPRSFARVAEAAALLRGNIADIERSVIGLDHLVVGKRLAERWELPATIRDCAWLHGQAPSALPNTVANPLMVNLISLADLLARQQHLGFSGNYLFNESQDVLREAVGLTPDQMERALRGLIPHMESRAAALGLGETSTQDLYQDALIQANRELGRVTGQLALKNRKLAVRAKFFDALSSFHADLRPDAPVAMVLQAIAQTAAETLGATAVAAISIPTGQKLAETVLFGAADVVETGLVDVTTRPSPPSAGPVNRAGDELEFALASLSPKLPFAGRFWIALLDQQTVVGAVVWGADGDESERLAGQAAELTALAGGWALALRTSQIRDESRLLSEQLADANRRLQDARGEVTRARMLASVGETAAGAAHEMNNPLMVITGRANLLATELTDTRQNAAAKLIGEQALRLSEIITDLMAFARPSTPKPESLDPLQLIAQSVQQARARTEFQQRTVDVAGDALPAVGVDARQITDALVEVIDNALQATDPAAGVIRIHAAHDPLSKVVVITISDNGEGMDDATLKRAFDPFFSSKPAGRRRGMGLAKALRWIESSGGQIRLESRPQQGTRAMILLPVQ